MIGNNEMQDQWSRVIDYLRLSVTDSCNLNCIYCRRPGCRPSSGPGLSVPEILRVLDCFRKLGIRKLKVTGGEPLLYPGIEDLLDQLLQKEWFSSVTITTNGQQVKRYWPLLSQLDSINVSLDSLKEETYRKMTRGGRLASVFDGLRWGMEQGYRGFKLNVVLVKGFNDEEIPDFLRLAEHYPLAVRFIELMPLGEGSRFQRVTREQALSWADRLYPGWKWSCFRGNGPARYLDIPAIPGKIGFIDSVSHPSCASCNRIRLDAFGNLYPCLEQGPSLNVRDFLQGTLSGEQFLQKLKQSIFSKPEKNHFSLRPCLQKDMYRIGG